MDFQKNALGLSHKFISEHVHSGDTCVDATAGRGRDTLFLCELVGEKGSVFAFDIQEEAIRSTNELLEANKKKATLVLDCHSKMDLYLEKESVDAFMFNFGWLPGGDHTKFSHGDTSCIAIEKALDLLKPGGVISLCIYCGKETGFEEKETLLTFLKTLDQKRYSVLLTDYINRAGNPPIAVFITKDA
ncbi:MAG: methyltransferase domain-containing protein [Ruminococcaceae bacterium]|nr:methyltransferase domain-containing protein [Oscillospiraceae bacterium]